MKLRAWIPLVVSLILGLLAAKMGRNMLVRGRQPSGQSSPTSPVVVLRHDVGAGAVLGQDDLTITQLPAQSLPRNVFGNPDNLIGRVVLAPLVKDQVVLESLLASAGTGSGPQALLPKGMRAITIEVNEVSGVGGLLVPGCRVDIVSTMQDTQSGQPLARTIVQNVKVMAVGRRLTPAKRDDDEQPLARSVTLVVSPQEAEMVDLASSSGRARLVLRGTMDSMAVASTGMTIGELLGQRRTNASGDLFAWLSSGPGRVEAPKAVLATPPLVAKAAPKQINRRTVEVISGSTLSKVEFELSPALPVTADTQSDGRGD